MIAHIIFNVRDFKESERFYDTILLRIGFLEEYKEDNAKETIKSYRKQNHNFWIKCNKENEHQGFIRDVGLDHIAFLAETKEEIDEMYEVVKTLNVKITREPRPYPEYSDQYYAFYFRDPNGIPIELCYM